MAVAQRLPLVAVLLLLPSGLHGSSVPPACPEPCTCPTTLLLNCSYSGLSSLPHNIQDSVTELDLSHNLLSSVTLARAHRNLRKVQLGNNSITHLSLCIERNLGSRYITDNNLRHFKPSFRRGCISWAPSLQLLSVERNQLELLPEGLEGSKFLEVLHLSYNRISTLQPGDLRQLPRLKELHLQHNRITSLHPQMFQDLSQLRVLDLRFNMLTSLHPVMYFTLRTIGVEARLEGNRWLCDCNMRSLRRRMAYDTSRGLQTWRVVCASPSILSGKDLLQVEEDDLNCLGTENMAVLHQDVSVYSGSKLLLTCSTQGPVWWTPRGTTSVGETQVISDVTERDTGLYVCVSEDQSVVSVFNLQVSKIGGTRRNPRSLSRSDQQLNLRETQNSIGQESRQAVGQSQLALAVCLSILITFLIAFILGVFARPYIDVVWKKVTTKKRSSASNSGSSVEQRQYDNEAFSSVEEPEEIPTHRERRVTFSTVDIRDDTSVHYYDTVAGCSQESINNGAVVKDLGRENPSKHGIIKGKKKPGSMERRSQSSSSDSSVSDEENQKTQRDRTTESPKLEKDLVQQRPDFSTPTILPQISIEGTSGTPGFTTEPFAEWSPHAWQENEEQFEFSDSVRSTSARSSIVSNSLKSDNQKRADTSSSSSYVSAGEPTHYTVNPEQEIKENWDHKNAKHKDDIERSPQRTETSSSDSSDNDGKTLKSRAKKYKNKKLGQNRKASDSSLSSSSSSSSDSEDKTTHHIKPEKMNDAEQTPAASHNSKTQLPAIDLKRIPRIPRRLDIKAPSLRSDSSSSSDSEKETTNRPGKVAIEENLLEKSGSKDLHAKRPIPDTVHSKAPSLDLTSTSSSDSEDETVGRTKKQNSGKVETAEFQFQGSPILTQDSKSSFPAIDLDHVPRIKRRLDVKVLSLDADSSSSSEIDEKPTGQREQQRPGKVIVPHKQSQSTSSSSSDSEDEVTTQSEKHIHSIKRIPVEINQTVKKEPQTPRPVLDLQQTTSIERRPDNNGSDSSSSSDSEDEVTRHTGKQSPAKVDVAELHQNKPGPKWPALDLNRLPHIKRRLDFKVKSVPSESSSSSDDEDKKTFQGEKPTTKIPVEITQAIRKEPQTQRPVLDLQQTTSIKRHPHNNGSDSSSSSDSEDEVTRHTGKQSPAKLAIAEQPKHESGAKWPALDFNRLPHIKRRLDIKVPSLDADSSSSCESEHEVTAHSEKPMTRIPVEISQAVKKEPQTQRPVLGHQQTTSINRRPDIKNSDSSSSSDSEDGVTRHTGKQSPEKTDKADLSPHELDARWPALDLNRLPQIKRRLDFKVKSVPSFSSEDGVTPQGEKHTPRIPIEVSQTVRDQYQKPGPLLDLQQTTSIKRSPDIKHSDSSSSSDSDDEVTSHTRESPPNKPDARWPTLDINRLPRIKRRLDIKAPSVPPDSSSSTDSEDEATNQIKKKEQVQIQMARPVEESQTFKREPNPQMPDLGQNTSIKRGQDIKVPSAGSDSSSSSDSEDESANQKEMQRQPLKVDISENPLNVPEAKWPTLDLKHLPHIKRRLDVKAPSRDLDLYRSSDSENEKHHINMEELTLQKPQKIIPNSDSHWPTVDLGNIPHIKKRLDIKVLSAPHDSLLSGGSKSHTGKENKEEAKTLSSSSSSSDEEEGAMKKLHIPPPTLPNPDPRWPKLDLSVAIPVKRRLDVKVHKPSLESVSTVSSHQSSSDSSSSESEDEKTKDKDLITFTKTPLKNISSHAKTEPSITLEKYTVIADGSSSTLTSNQSSTSPEINQDLHLKWNSMNLGISRFRKRLEITARAPPSSPSSKTEGEKWSPSSQLPVGTNKETSQSHIQKKSSSDVRGPLRTKSSSSSSSEDEMMHQSAVDLSFGVPRIKRYLHFKAPSPEKSDSPSSTSEDEMKVKQAPTKASKHVPNMSETTDVDSVITYKRLIMKAPSLPSMSQPSTTHQEEMFSQNLPSNTKGNIIQSLSQGRVLSRNFSDVVKKRTDESQSRGDMNLPPQLKWTGISRHLSDVTVSGLKTNLDTESPFPQQATAESDTLKPLSEERREQKGLSALKVMSSQRRTWDADDEALEHGPQQNTRVNNHRSKVDMNFTAKQPFEQSHISSTLSDGNRVADLLYGIPRYRRHITGGTEPPQEAPPPVPATPPPDEAVELTWSSPTRSKLTTRNQEGSSSLTAKNLAQYFDSSKMNISDV